MCFDGAIPGYKFLSHIYQILTPARGLLLPAIRQATYSVPSSSHLPHAHVAECFGCTSPHIDLRPPCLDPSLATSESMSLSGEDIRKEPREKA